MPVDSGAEGGPRLILSLVGDPPAVVAEREQIDDVLWYRLSLIVADEAPRPGQPMVIRPERLVRERLALRGVLAEEGVGLGADDAVGDLLRRSQDDDRAIHNAMAGAELEDDPIDEPEQPDAPDVVRELRDFQIRDLDVLRRLRHGANFSVPGAGKTTVTYAVHAAERRRGRVARMLVVAPLSAFGAWEEDAPVVLEPAPRVARWRGGPVPDCDVLLVNYQRLPSALPQLGGWLIRHRVHLVVDEAHRAKRGARGEWGRALLTLAPLAARRDVLTGTPAPNHPRDLAALLDILWPGGVASSSLPQAALGADPPLAAMGAVNRVIRPLYVRTTKEELHLPPVRIWPLPVDLGPLQEEIYSALLNRYAGLFDLDRRDAAMFAQMGEVAMYLLQAASSPALLANDADPARVYRYPPLAIPPGSRLARLVEDYADHEIPAKIERACRIVHQNSTNDLKTLVWSNFPDNLLALEQQLAGLNPAIVYGAIPSLEDAEPGVRTRERELERFRDDAACRVLLANPAALGEGVSLHHSCHDAVYVDRTFNAGQYLQSLDRIHRLGLEPGTETRITLLMSTGTIDERVNRRVVEKARRLAGMLDDPGLVQLALPDDDDVGPVIDDELDLAEVLQHLAEGFRGADAGEEE
ncbi:MAG: hypothetical protein QOG53_3228 [Frankiales bacterium]|jgi:SNF2 family DNA or RNA helicase|nr:hypothetical protein [Frankiales bacterium]